MQRIVLKMEISEYDREYWHNNFKPYCTLSMIDEIMTVNMPYPDTVSLSVVFENNGKLHYRIAIKGNLFFNSISIPYSNSNMILKYFEIWQNMGYDYAELMQLNS